MWCVERRGGEVCVGEVWCVEGEGVVCGGEKVRCV